MHLASQFWSKNDSLSVIDYLTFDSVKTFVNQVDDRIISYGLIK
jgi:hypothetical protein